MLAVSVPLEGRIGMRNKFYASLSVIVISIVGCSVWRDRPLERSRPTGMRGVKGDLDKYKASLRLEVLTTQLEIEPGENMTLNLTLTNSGAYNLEPCLSKRGALQFWGLDKPYVKTVEFETDTHPSCELPLHVPRGESVSWTRNFIVPSVPESTAKLVASIYLIDPKTCDAYGCYGILLSAHTSSLKMLAARNTTPWRELGQSVQKQQKFVFLRALK